MWIYIQGQYVDFQGYVDFQWTFKDDMWIFKDDIWNFKNNMWISSVNYITIQYLQIMIINVTLKVNSSDLI